MTGFYSTYSITVKWNGTGTPTAFDDMTSRVLTAGGLSWGKGRDSSRSLSPTTPGEAAFVSHNRDGLYSPDLASGGLFGKLGPGKKVIITGTPTSEAARNLFTGFLDGYTINADPFGASVSFTAQDSLAVLSEETISMGVVQSSLPGALIGLILDEVGWPAPDRDIDPGTTVISWWCEHDISALEAIQKIVASEGSPAFVDTDATGKFVFKDRNHRVLDSASTSVQATFRNTGTEPLYSEPVTYDAGFKDLINSVEFTVDVRTPDPVGMQPIWTNDEGGIFTLGVAATKIFDIVSESPFYGAVAPDDPYDITSPEEPLNDIALTGGTVSTTISRTSGKTLRLTVTGLTGTSVIKRIRVSAVPIIVASTIQIISEDATSIAANKIRSFSGEAPVWAGEHDAKAIADRVIYLRKNRTPIISFTLNNGSTERVQNSMDRQLSDRINFIEPVLGLASDFFIETIEHHVTTAGGNSNSHEVVFGCEKALASDVASTVFILGTSLIGTGTLGA